MPERRKRSIAVAGALVVGVVLLAWRWPRSAPGPEAASAKPARNGVRAEIGRLDRAGATPSPGEGLTSAIEIVDVEVEKPELCRGESTFIKVTAEGGAHDDLQYQTMYVRGALPQYDFGRFTRYVAPRTPGTRRVKIFVEDGAGGHASRDVEITTKDCDLPADQVHPYELQIRHRELDSFTHEFSVERAAEAVEKLGKSFQVLGWDFGDGKMLETRERVGSHRYEPILTRRYNYYLVKARVRIDGAEHELRHGFTFYSYVGANLKAGYVVLAVNSYPAPETDTEASFMTRFTNLVPYTAVIERIQKDCIGPDGLPIRRENEAVRLVVKGNGKLWHRFTVDKRTCPAGMRYELFGTTEEGYEAGTVFAHRLDHPVPELSREETDARLKQFLDSVAAEEHGQPPSP